MITFRSELHFGEPVTIDGDTSIEARVTGLMWRSGEEPSIEVSWFHKGALRSAWLPRWRLTVRR